MKHMRKLLTIITEAAIEGALAREIEALGAHGYTVGDVRGKGGRGKRGSEWDASGSIRMEVVCDAAVAEAISEFLRARYFNDYAMIIYVADVAVLRSEKF